MCIRDSLFARAKEISDSQDIPFEYFLPLIDETTQKIHELEPKLAQTGPAVRGDNRTLEPVSYTHLDVYKRQFLWILPICISQVW